MVSYGEEEIGAIVRRVLGLLQEEPVEVIPLSVRGSQRSYYRIRYGTATTAVFMHYDAGRRENNYYAALAGFLEKIGVPAPRIFHHDPEQCFIIMEDLGGRELWHFRQASWKVRGKYYFKTLDIIGKLHSFRQEDFPLIGIPVMEAPFNAALYRWEHDYFRQNFVQSVCKVELGAPEAKALDKELALLADGFSEAPQCLIHRDLQSQNIMIRDGNPVLIDFQGMRCGNPFYDLGSLLYDPYVTFTEKQRMELLHYYYRLFGDGGDLRIFREKFREASAQRLMQALGAYGFLGLRGRHPEFLAYIPLALANLIETTAGNPNLSLLRELAVKCRQTL